MAGYKVTYKPSSAGATALLNCPAMISGINACVQGIAATANGNHHGGTYVADTRPGSRRAHGMVKTADFMAILDNSHNNTLLKALGGGKV